MEVLQRLSLSYEEGAVWAEFLLAILGRNPSPCLLKSIILNPVAAAVIIIADCYIPQNLGPQRGAFPLRTRQSFFSSES